MCNFHGNAESLYWSYEPAELKAPETQESQGRGREPEVEVGGEERAKDGVRKEEWRKRENLLQSLL